MSSRTDIINQIKIHIQDSKILKSFEKNFDGFEELPTCELQILKAIKKDMKKGNWCSIDEVLD